MEKQDDTKQLAALPVETKQKTSYGLCGETRQRTIRSTCKWMNREKKKTQAATTPAACTYKINLHTDGLKQQDYTAPVL